MALLAALAPRLALALAAGSLVACYDPPLRDCTVSCSAATDCARGQECTGGWCVAPGTVCTAGGDVDGRDDDDDDDDPPTDARAIDARVIDAAPMVTLRIEVKGRGRVDTDRAGVSCDGPDGDCRFELPADTDVTFTPVDGDHEFHRWRNACEGQGTTCMLTIRAATHVKAEFQPSGDD